VWIPIVHAFCHPITDKKHSEVTLKLSSLITDAPHAKAFHPGQATITQYILLLIKLKGNNKIMKI
jgi:hypothetical protein